MDKERILRRLYKRNYLRELHTKIKEGLITSLIPEYLNLDDEGNMLKMPFFRHLVDIFASLLLNLVSEKLIEEILLAIKEQEVSDGKSNS